ncbi:hypothetical protein JKI95_11110 [Corynebacterium aquatimens]|uniref:hypothetical protein n=1 Tax=Corynebacterium TaxID=1716 RepID=UPI001F3F0186|nr:MULTISPECIES: hypothetical protein [Corynebacterium]QYH19558.1 hypothetical protein JKI95_11110 [Corynebacterium aquatimens]UIZ91482.1 hypothetical protein JZY91_06855 [Corynebacterium sp. CNCTC7651]
MRNLRKAALAGATAVAIAFGGTSVALAQDANPAATDKYSNANSENAPEMPTNGVESVPADLGKRLQADQTVYGPAIFGSSKGSAPGEKESFSEQPIWGQILYGLTITGAVASILGLIIAPVYNFVVHGR